MKTETITWHEVTTDPLPDAEITVLMQVSYTEDGGGTEVITGWLGEQHWCDITGYPIQPQRVVAWADVPAGVTC
jgi:hypothetical protein